MWRKAVRQCPTTRISARWTVSPARHAVFCCDCDACLHVCCESRKRACCRRAAARERAHAKLARRLPCCRTRPTPAIAPATHWMHGLCLVWCCGLHSIRRARNSVGVHCPRLFACQAPTRMTSTLPSKRCTASLEPRRMHWAFSTAPLTRTACPWPARYTRLSAASAICV